MKKVEITIFIVAFLVVSAICSYSARQAGGYLKKPEMKLDGTWVKAENGVPPDGFSVMDNSTEIAGTIEVALSKEQLLEAAKNSSDRIVFIDSKWYSKICYAIELGPNKWMVFREKAKAPGKKLGYFFSDNPAFQDGCVQFQLGAGQEWVLDYYLGPITVILLIALLASVAASKVCAWFISRIGHDEAIKTA